MANNGSISGAFKLPKNGSAMSAGDTVGWDNTNGEIVPGAGDRVAGRVVSDAAAGDAKVAVLLPGLGTRINYTVSGSAVTSKQVVLLEDSIGICLTDGAVGDVIAVAI